jgi:hypothetical protein
MANPSDVFLSYSHLDNEAAEGVGFISRLVKFIQVGVSLKYGRRVTIWWDENLAAGTQWNQEIYDQLSECRVFLAIVSPSWTNSQWAGQEWHAVWNRLAVDQTLGTQTRIIPVSFEYSKGFISTLPEQQRSLQFRRHFRMVMTDAEFKTEVDALAEDISRLLKRLDEKTAAEMGSTA